MKIYRDVIDQNGLRTRGQHQPVGIILLAISLAAGVLVPGQSSAQLRSQPKPQTESKPPLDLAAMRALMKRVEAVNPRPAKVSATQIQGNGFWETQELNIAWLGLMRRVLPTVRSAHPDLIRYWIVRTEERPESYNTETKEYIRPDIEPDKDGHYKWPFSWQVIKVVASTPGLSQWAGQLQAASDSVIQGVRETLWNSTDDVTAEEKAVKRRAIDMEGRRLALIKVIRGMLGAAGELDPERNTAWQPLYRFLTQDANQEWTKASKARDETQRVNFAVSPAYYRAHNPPAAIIARFEKLEAIKQRLTAMSPQLLENALAPGQTPMTFLEGTGSEFINSQIEFDRELARALDSPEVRADPSLIRVFDGMYGIWESLERYEDFLRLGKRLQSVGLLMNRARLLQRAASWDAWNEIDPDTGKSVNDFSVQRSGQTIDVMNKYKERWLVNGAPDGPLYAAVEVDKQGRLLWTHSSWILWKWITASDLDDLKVDGRVVNGLGRNWLLPAGSAIRSISSLQDVQAADAREVIVALDPAGPWKDVREVTP